MIHWIKELAIQYLRGLGLWCFFAFQALEWTVRRPYRWRHIFKQFEFIGVQSIPIILLTGLFTGMVFALQSGKTFQLFQLQTMTGSTVGLALTREVGPVFTALMVTA